MDRDYEYVFPQDGKSGQKKRKRGAVLAAVLALVLLLGVGGAALAVFLPPSLGPAISRTFTSLVGDTEALAHTLETLGELSVSEGAELALKGTLPASLTGGESMDFSLQAQTAPGEEQITRCDFELSAADYEVSLSLFENGERWWVEVPDSQAKRAYFLDKQNIAERLRASAWNPAVNAESGLSEESFQALMSYAEAWDATNVESAVPSEGEQKELDAALRALGKAWRRIIAPESERLWDAGLHKRVRVSLDYDKLLQMIDALRTVMAEYPALEDLIRSTVTFTEYGEELLPDDAVAEASLPDATVPQPIPLSAEETGEMSTEEMLHRLEEWIGKEQESGEWRMTLLLTVSGGRLSALDLDWLWENGEGARDAFTLCADFPRPDPKDEHQSTATVYWTLDRDPAPIDGLTPDPIRRGEYWHYTRKDAQEKREYLLTVAADPDGGTPSHDLLSSETEEVDPTLWPETTRYGLRYDVTSERYSLFLEEREDEAEDWTKLLRAEGAFRPSDSGTRLEIGLERLTLMLPVPDAQGMPTGELAESAFEPRLSLVWQARDGSPLTLPETAEDVLALDAARIREVMTLDVMTDLSDMILVAFGGGETIYTVDGLRLRDTAYYQAVAQAYLNLYQTYVNRYQRAALAHLYIYDEESGLYVLLDYDASKNYLAINFLANMTDRYESAYHVGTLQGGFLEGHVFENAEGLEPTCTEAGYSATKCRYCTAMQKTERAAKGHRIGSRQEKRIYDNGVTYSELYEICEVCGSGRDDHSYAWVASRYHLAVVRDPAREEVALTNGFSGDMSRGTVLWLPNAVGADGKYPVTTLKSGAFSSSEMYTLNLVRFGENIRHVESGAFAGATGLQILVLYPTLEQIDADAFAACKSLRKVYFCGTEAEWKRIRIASGNEPLTRAELILGHDGSAVGAEVINTTAAASSLRTLTSNSRDGKQDAVLAAHPDADRLTVLSTAAVQTVAYDADSDTVIVCGGYENENALTTVTFFDATTGEVRRTMTLPYRVSAMDAGDGYAAFGEGDAPTVHLYRLSDGVETVTYDVKMNSSKDRIGYVFIDRGVVIACNAEKHCYIDFYQIASGSHVKSESMYEPALALDKASHTLAAITQNSTPKSIYFYDTQTGGQITWLWNVQTSAPLYWNGNAFETSSMTFSVAGEPIETAGSGLDPSTPPENSMVYETVMRSSDFVFWTVAIQNREQKTVLARTMARTEKMTLSEPLAFYATRILRLGNEDRFLMWDEGYTRLLIVDLR